MPAVTTEEASGSGRRIAVLGCGSIGRRHLRNLQTLGATDLTVFEPDAARCRDIEAESGVTAAADLESVWERLPEIAVVAAPTQAHAAAALAAARHGCHLFIEKPLSHSLEGLDLLGAEVEARGLQTMIGCNMRFHPGPAQVKALLERGEVGVPLAARIQTGSYLPRWRPGQDYGQSYSASPEYGGAILDCIHEIDLALWYFGPAALLAAAHLPARTLGLETDGLAEIILRHGRGPLSSVHLNFVQRDYRRCCQIIGSEGTIYWDFAARRVDVYGPDGEQALSLPEPEHWQANQMYLEEMDHFLRAVRRGEPPMNSLSQARETLEIALAARVRGNAD